MNDIPFQRPVVLIGGLHRKNRDRVRDFVRALNAPVYAEAVSGLRGDEDLMITAGERMIARGSFDGVIRIGNVPTLRFWRDLDESMKQLPVISFNESRFAGLSRGEVRGIDELPRPQARARDDAFFKDDRRLAGEISRLLDDEPQSELAMIRKLSATLSDGARVYLGNSLPIREWDLVAVRNRVFECDGNRGANGIDGQLSTFFGWCAPDRENVALLGDLTTIYDMNAPWIVPQLDSSFRIVVVNNGGGRIFSRVASLRTIDRRLMENEHAFSFDRWAAMWGIADRVVELRPDRAASDRVWQRYDKLWT